MKIETVTEQQQESMKEYFKHTDESEGFELPFWNWYCLWCEEQGLFNDRSSFQFDEEVQS